MRTTDLEIHWGCEDKPKEREKGMRKEIKKEGGNSE